MIKDYNYLHINAWMVTRLGLKGNSLIIYAIIFAFSQIDDHTFHGSLQYLADWTSSTKQSVMKCLKELIGRGLITKDIRTINNVKYVDYKICEDAIEQYSAQCDEPINNYAQQNETLQDDNERYETITNNNEKEKSEKVSWYETKFNGVCNKVSRGMKQSLMGGMQQSLPHNKDIDNIEDTKEEIKESKKEKINKKKMSPSDTKQFISDAIQSSDFSDNVKNALAEFVQCREELKKPVTSFAITRLINKLHSLSNDPDEQVEIINQSIERNYSGLFPVSRGYSGNKNYGNEREAMIAILNRLTEADIRDYCSEKNYTHVDAFEFLGNYKKRGWMVGNAVVTDWRSAVDEWEAREVKKIKDKEDEERKIYHRSYMNRCLND